jgi:hypothetical protein
MAEYRVKCLNVCGKKKYYLGDIVNEKCFPEQNIAKLVADGYLEPVEQTVEKKAEAPKQPEPAAKPSLEEVTAKQMKEDLEAAGIEYEPKAKKAELYALWITIKN